MATSEKFCLRGVDFQENVNTAFRDLREDSEFTDVTLACEDGYQVEAHKVILAASSAFFRNLLIRNKHSNQLIYMRGMESNDLLSILDYLYFGEAYIHQQNLNSFLTIAEELKLKGLNKTEELDGEEEGYDASHPRQTYRSTIQRSDTKRNNDTIDTKTSSHNNLLVSQTKYDVSSIKTGALPKEMFSGNIKDLYRKIESMMYRGENMIGCADQMRIAYICKVCGKQGQKSQVQNHIEANHIEGISLPCNLCEKTFKLRESLRSHKTRSHTNNI